MKLKLYSGSPLKSSGGAPSAWGVLPMDNPPSTEEAVCSREDFSADLSAREAVLSACRHAGALGICVCNLCRPEISPFSVKNVHVLENVGSLVVAKEESVCLNWVCLTLKSLTSTTESPVRTIGVSRIWPRS